MEQKIGFIGSGNMGGAIIGGILRAGLVEPEQVLAADRNTESLKKLEEEYGIHTTGDNCVVAEQADILFLSVKPQVYPSVISEIRDRMGEGTLVVSIAAGQTIASIEEMFGREIHLVRVMPNTPALVGEGMAALVPNRLVTEEEKSAVKQILESVGKCQEVPETMMDAVIGVSGSSPAYVYMFIEALADAAVMGGMPRVKAYEFAAQSVLGAAKMVLETGKHPGELKDMVCSPAGTTIAAVARLEETGFRSSVIEGTLACMRRAGEMTKP